MAEAYPLRTGTCRAGASIGTSSGGTHGADGMGSLEENGFVVLGGSNTVLERWRGGGGGRRREWTVPVDTSLSVSIATVAPQGYYKGFLFRVEGTEGENANGMLQVLDAENSVLLPSDGDVIGPLASCAEHVAAISHSNGHNKTRSLVQFRAAQLGTYTLDVQLVVENGLQTRNFWVHSAYRIRVVKAPTTFPTIPPTPSTTTTTPSASPTITTPQQQQQQQMTNAGCPDTKFCRHCDRCRKVYETCANGQGYCTMCKNFCTAVYRGNVIFAPPLTQQCPKEKRLSSRCRRCQKYQRQNCDGGQAYCAYCQLVFPHRYQGKTNSTQATRKQNE